MHNLHAVLYLLDAIFYEGLPERFVLFAMFQSC